MKPMKRNRFEHIARQYKDFIYNYAYYFCGTREDAEDLTQEVLLRIWQNMDCLELGLTKSWVSTVTRNLCVDWSRRKSSRPEDPLGPENEEFILETLSARHEPGAEETDLRHIMEQKISQLPEQVRDVIILREIEDRCYEEISEMLNMPLNTVKSYIHRGRRMLRRQLSALHEDIERRR